MKIYDEHQKQVGEIERPEPVYNNQLWWELARIQKGIKNNECYLSDCGTVERAVYDTDRGIFQVMQPIPRPTPEQLKAIGMRERDDRPVLTKPYDYYWENELRYFTTCIPITPAYRWVLVPVERKSEPVKHYSCAKCSRQNDDMCETERDCFGGYNAEFHAFERKNWTAQVVGEAPAPKVTDAPKSSTPILDNRWIVSWHRVYSLCMELGMKHELAKTTGQDVETFIRSLHKRAGEERYSTSEIKTWLQAMRVKLDTKMTYNDAIDLCRSLIEHCEDGIKAVTERNK